MSYSENEIMDITTKLEKVIDKLKDRALDWWWLDQGDAPIYSPVKVVVKGKKVSYERMPKVSLVVTLRTMRDNLKNIIGLDDVERVTVINNLSRELNNVYKIIENIFDANELVKKIESLTSIAKRLGGKEGNSIQKQLYNLLEEIKNTIKTTPLEWDKKREEFQAELNSISNKLKEKVETATEIKEETKETEKEETKEEEAEIESILEDLKKYEEMGEMEGA